MTRCIAGFMLTLITFYILKDDRMTTPLQRLARMQKSFAKDKSVLTADYKYFTTPDAPTKPRASIPRSKAARMSAEQSAPKSPKQS
jgi:hypothetical protein